MKGKSAGKRRPRAKPESVAEYMADLPAPSVLAVTKIRALVSKSVPGCTELVSYGIPAFRLERIFMYCAAFKSHIGIYPPVRDDARLIQSLRRYANDKGNLRFPLAEPIPYPLIARVAKALAKAYAMRPGNPRVAQIRRGSAAGAPPGDELAYAGPMEKMESASAFITAKIAALADWRGTTLARMRKLIQQADPDVVEEVKWRGTPVWSHDGILCTGETYKSVVKLTFARGASLKDPAKLFNSSLDGNVRRAIDIREGEQVDAEAFKVLVRQAVNLNRSRISKPAKKKKAVS